MHTSSMIKRQSLLEKEREIDSDLKLAFLHFDEWISRPSNDEWMTNLQAAQDQGVRGQERPWSRHHPLLRGLWAQLDRPSQRWRSQGLLRGAQVYQVSLRPLHNHLLQSSLLFYHKSIRWIPFWKVIFSLIDRLGAGCFCKLPFATASLWRPIISLYLVCNGLDYLCP